MASKEQGVRLRAECVSIKRWGEKCQRARFVLHRFTAPKAGSDDSEIRTEGASIALIVPRSDNDFIVGATYVLRINFTPLEDD